MSITTHELAEALGKTHNSVLKMVQSRIKNNTQHVYKETTYAWKAKRWARAYIISDAFADEIRQYKPKTRWSMFKVWEFIKQNNLEFIPLSTHYTAKKPMLWKCTHKDCYYEWPVRWSHIANDGSRCPKCAGTYTWTWELLQKELKKNKYKHIKCISPKPYNFKAREDYLEWACTVEGCGYTWSSLWSNVYLHNSCDRCNDREDITMEVIQRKKHLINPDVALLSTTCSSNLDPILCKCLKNPEHPTWYSCWATLQKGHGCRKCNFNNEGFYSVTRAERHKTEWLAKEALVYFIECYDNVECFYKIGLTTNTVKERMQKGRLPYEYSIIKTIKTNLYDAVHLENTLHKQHSEYSYKPKLYFEGYTECFTKLL